MQIRGEELDTLNTAAVQIMNLMRYVPGATPTSACRRADRSPELKVDLDRCLAATLGFSPADVANALRSGFAGLKSGEWVDPTGRTRDVNVRLAPSGRESASDVANLPLVPRTFTGTVPAAATTGAAAASTEAATALVPVGQLATDHQGLRPDVDRSLQPRQVITVGANVQGRPLSDVLGEVQKRVATVKLPQGTHITQGGQAESQSEVFGGILSALGLAIMLMYFILVVQFGSFLDPLAILISLPLSLIGVVLALSSRATRSTS